MVSITVPREYGYVLLSATSVFFLATWHGIRIGSFRKAAKLGYPSPYADSKMVADAAPEHQKALYLFNCAQRAHGNLLEHVPQVLAAMLISGLQYPITTAALSVVWSAGRIVYAVGYTSPNQTGGKGRLPGSFYLLAELGMYITTALTGYNLLMQ